MSSVAEGRPAPHPPELVPPRREGGPWESGLWGAPVGPGQGLLKVSTIVGRLEWTVERGVSQMTPVLMW